LHEAKNIIGANNILCISLREVELLATTAQLLDTFQ